MDFAVHVHLRMCPKKKWTLRHRTYGSGRPARSYFSGTTRITMTFAKKRFARVSVTQAHPIQKLSVQDGLARSYYRTSFGTRLWVITLNEIRFPDFSNTRISEMNSTNNLKVKSEISFSVTSPENSYTATKNCEIESF